MSKLDELLRELCPNGVEHKRIGDFAVCFPGATPKTTHTLNTGKMEQFRG